MSLVLHYHPLASFCHKVLLALYENETPFTGHVVDLADQRASAGFTAVFRCRHCDVIEPCCRSACAGLMCTPRR